MLMACDRRKNVRCNLFYWGPLLKALKQQFSCSTSGCQGIHVLLLIWMNLIIGTWVLAVKIFKKKEEKKDANMVTVSIKSSNYKHGGPGGVLHLTSCGILFISGQIIKKMLACFSII